MSAPAPLDTRLAVARTWRYPVKSMRGEPAAYIDVARIGVAADGAEPIEQRWLGATLRVGDEAVLRVTEPTERCGMVALAQDGLRHDPRVLRHITQNAGLMFGVYAEVVAPGRIHAGDAVVVDLQARGTS